MKKTFLTLILFVLVVFTAISQTSLPSPEWTGQYIGSDTLVKPNGDIVFIFGYILASQVNYVDSTSIYLFRLNKAIVTTGDTTYSEFTFREYYGLSDTLFVAGAYRSGAWLLNYHYNSAWRADDQALSRALYRKKRDITGW